MSSLSIIKSIKQSTKNDGDLSIIYDLLKQEQTGDQYFPDKDLFCLEHLVFRINNNNIHSLVNNRYLYENFDLIYTSNQDLNKKFVTILKNIKLNNLLLNIDFTKKDLLKILNEKFLSLLINCNISFQDLSSETFITKILTQYSEFKDGENEADVTFISNLLKMIQFHKFVSNINTLSKFIKLEHFQVNELIIHEFFENKNFNLTNFLENMKISNADDQVFISMFKLVCVGFLRNRDKLSKDIIDQALNKFVELGTNKFLIFYNGLDFINSNFELKKLNNLPKLETLEKWLNEFIDNLNDTESDRVFVKCLINNIEIAQKYMKQILNLLKTIERPVLCEAMLDCFVDLKEYYCLIKYIIESELDYMANYEKFISARIHNLSSYQLSELLNTDCKFLKKSIIKGMDNVNTITFIQNNKDLQKWLKKSIFQQSSFSNLEILYNLLTLYSKSIIPNIGFDEEIQETYKQELRQLAKIQLDVFDDEDFYSYFSILKTLEISIEYDTTHIDTKGILSKFVQHFENDLHKCLLFIKQFTTILNNNMDKDILDKLVGQLFFNNSESLKLLLDDLVDKNDDIWEEEVIVEVLIKHLIYSFDHTNLEKEGSMIYRLLEIVPVELFNKFEKNKILEKLYTLNNCNALLLKFLSTPTFKTSLELQGNFEKLLNCGNMTLFDKIWGNYLVNINDESCFNYVNSSVEQLILLVGNIHKKQLPYVVKLIALSKSNEKIQNLIQSLFNVLLQRIIQDKFKDIDYYGYTYQLYELEHNNNTLNKIITDIIENHDLNPISFELQYNLFVSYCLISKKDFYAVLPPYLKLRKDLKIDRITDGLAMYLNAVIIDSDESSTLNLLNCVIHDLNNDYKSYFLELVNFIIPKINKGSNDEAYCKLFASLLSNLFEDISVVNLDFLQNLNSIVITKSWILKQYNVELIIPFLIQTISSSDQDQAIVLESLKIVSNIINHHQFKLIRRGHLVISFIVFVMDYAIQVSGFNSENVMNSLNRLIMNYIDPINIVTNTNNSSFNSLKSNVLTYKQELRKYIYPVMLKYIQVLCNIKVSTPKSLSNISNFRLCLKFSMYSIFDILMKDNVNLLYNLLDYNGKLYFKKLYKDYELEGKWKED